MSIAQNFCIWSASIVKLLKVVVMRTVVVVLRFRNMMFWYNDMESLI